MIKKHKLYYLVHPATTYGSLAENKKSAIKIKQYLMKNYEVNVINPLEIFTGDAPWDEVMDQCYPVIDQCTGVVLSPNWLKSKGCRREAVHAMESGKEIYLVIKSTDGKENYGLAPATYEEIKLMLTPEKTGVNILVRKSVELEMLKGKIILKEFFHDKEEPKIHAFDPKTNTKFNFLPAFEPPVKTGEVALDEVLDEIMGSVNFDQAASYVQQDSRELLSDTGVLAIVGKQQQLSLFHLNEDDEISDEPESKIYMNENTAILLRMILFDMSFGRGIPITESGKFYMTTLSEHNRNYMHLGLRGSSQKERNSFRFEKPHHSELVQLKVDKRDIARIDLQNPDFKTLRSDEIMIQISKGDSDAFCLSAFQVVLLYRLLENNYEFDSDLRRSL